MREVASSLVRQDSVAVNGVSATVRTSEIAGGGPVGTDGAVVVAVVVPAGVPGVGTVAPVGNAMKVKSRVYGAL